MNIEKLVAVLLENEPAGLTSLAHKVGVPESKILDWMTGRRIPEPEKEDQLKHIALNQSLSLQELYDTEFVTASAVDDLRIAIRDVLQQVREILHRGGHLSSRQEALDELSKLLFAHVISIDTGGNGIGQQLLVSGQTPVAALRDFVAHSTASNLPKSISVNLNTSDFELNFRESENKLCVELIDCFSTKLPKTVVLKARDAGTLDILNETFGQFLSDSFIDEKELGQYLTPTEVVRPMVRLGLASLSDDEIASLCSGSATQTSELILDPSCGVGSFLAETLRALYTRAKWTLSTSELSSWVDLFLRNNLVGIDKSERMVRLAMANLALFGMPAANVHLANSLFRSGTDGNLSESLVGRVSLLLTNPPFGAEFSGHDLTDYKIGQEWASRPPKSVDSELLFVERYIEWLAPGGVLVAIVPDSILTNRGIYQHLRDGIAKSVELLSVISLPTVTFAAAGTDTKTSILHLRKKREVKNENPTFFAICSDVGYDVFTRGTGRRKIPTGRGQLPKILRAAISNEPSEHGRWVCIERDILRWDAVYHAGLPEDVQLRIENKRTEHVLVSQVASISRDKVNPRNAPEEKFKYVEISDVDGTTCTMKFKWIASSEAPSRARKLIRTGDVLVSTVRPERRTVGVVGDHLDGSICSTGFAVLRPTKIDPYVLARLLQSDFVCSQILRNNVGIAYPAIDEECLSQVLLPIDLNTLVKFTPLAKEIGLLQQQLRAAEARFSQRLESSIGQWLKV